MTKHIPKITDVHNKKLLEPIFDLGIKTVLNNSKRRLLKYLKQKDYKNALALLAALAQTGMYHPSSYWKVGEEIIRQLDPQDLSNYLRITINGIKKPYNEENVKEFILHLLANDNPDKYLTVKNFISELHLSLKERKKNAAMTKFFALISYDDWNNQHRLNTDNETLITLKKTLKEAYEMNKNDRYVIKCYLDVLNQSKDESDKIIIKQTIESSLLNCNDLILDPELIGILLHFGKDYVDQTISWQFKLCSADPLADPRIAFLPLINILESVPHRDTRLLLNIILDRLEYGCRNPLVIKKLHYFANSLKNLDVVLKNETWELFKSRDILMTLEMMKLDILDEDIDQITLRSIEHIIGTISEFMENGKSTQPRPILEDTQNHSVKRTKYHHDDNLNHPHHHMNHQNKIDKHNENNMDQQIDPGHHKMKQPINLNHRRNMDHSNPWIHLYN